MTTVARVDEAACAGWPDLIDELDRWEGAGRVAALWWRDDDAITATPQLEALLRLAGSLPLALAVIPALARPDLAAALEDAPSVAVLQHGWRHQNRAERGKKSEYPEGRSAAVVGAEIGAGQARLRTLFGRRAEPVFVPPWNRIADEFLPLLPARGIAALSSMARSRAAALPGGLSALDVHIDPVCWRGDRGFVGTAAALALLVGRLRARRLGDAPAAGPIGLLTHHLVMDGATVAFVSRLVEVTAAHPAARWAAVGELLR